MRAVHWKDPNPTETDVEMENLDLKATEMVAATERHREKVKETRIEIVVKENLFHHENPIRSSILSPILLKSQRKRFRYILFYKSRHFG